MKILAVIPARGGSKGVPRKNVRMLGDKPLVAWAINVAIGIKPSLHRILVSTDDEEIASVSRQYGAEVPFMRPANLAEDKSPMIPVLKHAIQFVEEQDQVRLDWVLLLQPTAPFRTPEDLHAVIDLAQQGSCDSVISVVQVFSTHPILMKRIENDRLLPFCIEEKEGTRRQDYQPPAYMRNGAIYMTRRDNLMERNSIWGDFIRPYVMPETRSVNVDSELDFLLAEFMVQKRSQVQDQ